jgi:hypothetical protein
MRNLFPFHTVANWEQKFLAERQGGMKSFSILYWYSVLRGHYQLTMFDAIRYAWWLSR